MRYKCRNCHNGFTGMPWGTTGTKYINFCRKCTPQPLNRAPMTGPEPKKTPAEDAKERILAKRKEREELRRVDVCNGQQDVKGSPKK